MPTIRLKDGGLDRLSPQPMSGHRGPGVFPDQAGVGRIDSFLTGTAVQDASDS